MLTLSILLLLGQAAASAEPVGNPVNWFTYADVPTDVARSGGTSVVAVELLLDETGRPMRCAVLRPSKSPNLDATVCGTVMRRARFKAARDEAGQPLPSAFVGNFAVSAGGRDPPPPPADLTLALNRSPGGKAPARATVRQILREDSTVESCAVVRSSGHAALDRLACAEVNRQLVLPPLRDAAGNPSRGVRSHVVDFVVAPADGN